MDQGAKDKLMVGVAFVAVGVIVCLNGFLANWRDQEIKAWLTENQCDQTSEPPEQPLYICKDGNVYRTRDVPIRW